MITKEQKLEIRKLSAMYTVPEIQRIMEEKHGEKFNYSQVQYWADVDEGRRKRRTISLRSYYKKKEELQKNEVVK